jgi:hypothetical protein
MLQKCKNIKFVNIFWVLFYILIFFVLLKNGFSYLDPDFGWHVKVGQEIFINKSAPSINHYNYTYTGNWVDHEWLSDLLLYLTYQNWGYEFLVIIFALVILISFIILNIFIKKYLKETKSFLPIVASLQLLGILASLPHFGVRIQEFGVLFLLFLLVVIEIYNRKKQIKYLFILPVLFLIWANFHASFLLGVFILFAWLGIKIVEKIFVLSDINFYWVNLKNVLSWRELKNFFYFIVLSISVTLINPYGLKLFDFLSGYKNKAYFFLIQEWLPQYSFPFHYDQLIYLSLGATALIFSVYFSFKKRYKIEIWPFFLAFLFLILSFKSRRHFPLFVVASFLFMVSFYGDFLGEIKIKTYGKIIKTLTIVCLFLTILAQIASLKIVKDPFNDFCNAYPCSAINFIRSDFKYLNSNMLNTYDWGGFLIWALPEKKLFIDGRLPQVEFAGRTFIEEYRRFFLKNENQENLLDQYGINLILIRSKDYFITPKKWEKLIFQIREEDLNKENYLRKYLNSSNDWALVYSDEVSSIYYCPKD